MLTGTSRRGGRAQPAAGTCTTPRRPWTNATDPSTTGRRVWTGGARRSTPAGNNM